MPSEPEAEHTEPAASLSFAIRLFDEDRFEEAEPLLREIIALRVLEAPKSMNVLGTLLYRQGRLEEAEAIYRRGIETGDAEYGVYANLNLGLMLEKIGRTDEAEIAFRQVVEKDHPRHSPQAMVSLGNHFMAQDRFEEAETAYRTAVDSGNPEHSAIALRNLGTLCIYQERFREAEGFIRELLGTEITEHLGPAWLGLGLVLSATDRPDEAEIAYLAAAEIGPEEVAVAAFTAIEELRNGTDLDNQV